MVYSTRAVVPGRAEQESEANDYAVKGQETKVYEPAIQATTFVDTRGNLKFVNFVVAHPCAVFLFIIGLCLVITVALSNLAFADGNPFTSETSAYDLYDQRSIAYDSLRLAKENVTKEFLIINESEGNGNIEGSENTTDVKNKKPLQENIGDVTYWIYEAKKKEGLFTKEALEQMRSTEDMLTKHVRYPNYCWLKRGSDSECRMSRSVVNIFYASEWNSTMAKELLSSLTKENVQLYNRLAACVELNYLCDFVPPGTTESDRQWVRNVTNSIDSMMVKWDGQGDLNKNMTEVSEFLAVVNELYTKSPSVQFFFDTNFTIDNPVTMYTRSMVYWGSPLEGAEENSFIRDKTSGGLLKK